MNKYNRHRLKSCLAVILLALAGCDGTVKAPPVEAVGLGSVYCQVNGQNWTNPPYFPYEVAAADRTDSGFYIGAVNYYDPVNAGSVVRFEFDALVVGPQPITRAMFSRMRSDECDSCGTVNLIAIDSAQSTLRGTFEFRIRSADGDSIQVTNGRFYVGLPFKI